MSIANNMSDKVNKTSIIIASDHAGYSLKEFIKKELQRADIEVDDKGTYSAESTDYPDYAHKLAEGVLEGDDSLGILICGSANGVSMAANKHQGIRAAIAWNTEVAELARLHNDANVISLPARFVTEAEAMEITWAFLKTEFEGGRHGRRVNKIDKETVA